MWKLLIFYYMLQLYVIGLPFYQQNDYDVIFERSELIWHNEKYFKNVVFKDYWHNRTWKVVNVSAYIDAREPVTDMMAHTCFLKWMSNEYRFFPLQISFSICEEYAKNTFNIRNMLKNISNMHNCPLERGTYYAKGLRFDPNFFPPFIPRGRFKSVITSYAKKEKLIEVHVYFEVKDKPLKWVE